MVLFDGFAVLVAVVVVGVRLGDGFWSLFCFNCWCFGFGFGSGSGSGSGSVIESGCLGDLVNIRRSVLLRIL